LALKAVLFDIDGTLVDSNEQHVDSWLVAFREGGHPQDRETVRSQIGKGGDLLVPSLIPGVDKDTQERLSERQGSHFKSHFLDEVRPFPSAAALVRRVHESGRKVMLASSAKREELEHYVELLGIGDCLAGSTSIDDVEASKPEPDIFSAALEKIGVTAGDALVIGDTPYDVEAARKAGIDAIGLTSGPFDRDELSTAGAVAVYSSVAELLERFDDTVLTA
jgi:HAD superfamily hydrolase (TIGR01509 family)